MIPPTGRIYTLVNAITTNLGILSPTTTAIASGTFTVRTYQAGGYQIQSVSSPPTNGEGYFLHTTAAGSCVYKPSPGTEFFGINLVLDNYLGSVCY